MNGLPLSHHLTTTVTSYFRIFCWIFFRSFCSGFTYNSGKDFLYFLSVSSCIDYYPTIIGKDFQLTFCSIFTNHHRDCYLYLVMCKQMYYLLPHHYQQGFFALFICPDKAKKFPKVWAHEIWEQSSARQESTLW